MSESSEPGTSSEPAGLAPVAVTAATAAPATVPSGPRWVRAAVAGAAIGIVALVGATLIGVGGDTKSCACADPRAAAAGAQVVSPAPTDTTVPGGTQPGSGVISRTITVSGEGNATVKPDTATVQLGVSVDRPTASAALDQANTSAAALIAALKQAGVAEDDITTAGLSIWPRYDNGSSVTGYTASNSVSVTVRDIDRTGPVIDAAAAAAGNDISVGGVSFSVDDPEQVMAAARADAIANAQKRAGEFATAAGVAVGAVLQISETSATPYQPRFYAADSASGTAPAAASTPIQTGTTDLSVTVTVVYALS
ncbi:MAG: hypothetical protein JWM12_766 [Ilumatobacteraceae bacterium]|jgi:uncharacterized protein YggE|nr:hypothetical protein [Ilumatobacteraceae bacterium]